MRRLIDPIELKHSIKISNILEDGKTIEELIDEQPAVLSWNPVSERLPDQEGMYLTTTMYGEVYYDYWNGDNFGRCETVIAWMNPPEPYKGGKQDG